MKFLKTFLLTLMVFLTSCNKEEIYLSRDTTSGVSPVQLTSSNGGNITCQEAADNIGLASYQYSTGRIDYANGTFVSNFGIFQVSTDGTNVSWTANPPSGFCIENVAIIVKGGKGANVYYYNNGETSDSGLTSPANASGSPSDLSNLTICYNLVECNTCIWEEETAYGGSLAGGGNAWWFAIDASVSGTYPIWAGQNIVQGSNITYDKINDLITINLGGSLQLQNVSEPVKVEGYNNLPNSRPSAGLFTLYKGSDLTIGGNNSNFYVVHLDVEVCK
jgi:hypothetical protein